MNDNMAGEGRGNFGNPEQHRDAGRAGGEATAKKKSSEFYSEIGSMGGSSSVRSIGSTSDESGTTNDNPGNFADDRDNARRAGDKGGSIS